MFCGASLQPATACPLPPAHVQPVCKIHSCLPLTIITPCPPGISLSSFSWDHLAQVGCVLPALDHCSPWLGSSLFELTEHLEETGHVMLVSIYSALHPAWLWDGAQAVCVDPGANESKGLALIAI